MVYTLVKKENMNSMKFIKLTVSLFILLVSVITYAGSDDAGMEQKIQGKWLSQKWSYGFRIEGMSGYVTQWNYKYNPNDETTVGDIILKIERYTSTGFLGEQRFFSGKIVPVVGSLIGPNTLKLEAGPEVWLMVRPK